MKATVISEAQYFPCIEYFIYLREADELILEAHENYQKHSYRNRCIILNSNGLNTLSVPLKKGKNNRSPILKTSIAYAEQWPKFHLRSIQAAYGRSPFFEHYMPHFQQIIHKKFESIYELNEALLNTLISLIGLDLELKRTTTFHKVYDPSFCDLRNKIKPNHRSINLPNYEQVFSDRIEFMANLSILDLLFCKGPETLFYLQEAQLMNQ